MSSNLPEAAAINNSPDAQQAQKPEYWADITVLGDNQEYPGQAANETRTTRYTALTFLPMTLYENFRILSNVYFLIVLIVCFLPWSPVSYIFQLTPMIFVISISMAKAGIEDSMKRREDNKRNNQPINVFRDGEWVKGRSADIKVGDLIRIDEDSVLPADVLYVGTANPDGLSYFSETNLNGETAVKSMSVHPAFANKQVELTLQAAPFHIRVGEPDRDLTHYDAKLLCGEEFWPISIHNVLLMGVSTHYTETILGIVMRTGHDCKIMQNMRHPPAKMTDFDVSMNTMLIIIFTFKIITCLTLTSVGVYLENNSDFRVIKDSVPTAYTSFMQYFVQNFILYSYLIPISITVTIELVRLFHKIVIGNDPDMTDEEFPAASAKNSNVIGQLGQITYMLSDKTGTLTENKMELLRFSTDAGSFEAPDFIAELNSQKEKRNQILPFLLGMALCNTVIVHVKTDGMIEYNADSPDEAAFVSFAAKCGVKLFGRTQEEIVLEIDGEKRIFNILATFPFNSTRKRMSILLKENGSPAVLYAKGADNFMDPRSAPYSYARNVSDYASYGLRTLVFACKVIPESDLPNWMAEYKTAEATVQGRDDAVAALAEKIELKFTVLGITGVEDRLQKDVPKSLKWLREAGIKVWVLTGDKLETALAIGKTAGLISHRNTVIIVSSGDADVVRNKLLEVTNNFSTFASPVLVVSDEAIEHAINTYSQEFLDVAMKCDAVILSRVSPFMKARITELVNTTKATTLAIGDGANDVGMLQVARVGVGIYGREGSQAAQSADFAIPRFRKVVNLLSVHGHWAYNRIAMCAMIILYKNAAFCIQQLWFAIENMSSPTSLFGDFYLSVYNVVFTLIPPFTFGFFEQDIPKETMLTNPCLYQVESDPLKPVNLVYYLLLGVYQSAACFYTVRLTMPTSMISEAGTVSYISVVYVATIQCALWCSYWNLATILTVVLTIILVPLIIAAYIAIADSAYMHVVTSTFLDLNTWVTIVVATILSLIPGMMIEYMRQYFKPSLRRKFAEKERRQNKVSHATGTVKSSLKV